MCGICGILTGRIEGVREAVGRMSDRIRHRGPDAAGLETVALPRQRMLALGHRRLSILDLSPAGNQPMRDPESGNMLVYNGELYNYRELRESLKRQGVTFVSHSDTEVILKAYAKNGVEALRDFEGMFAFALYDAARGRLLLARDPMGIKPLYYAWTPAGDFLFASEVRAFAASGRMAPELDRAALASSLAFGALQEPQTLLKGVRLLRAGEWMELALNDPPGRLSDYGRFWDFPVAGSFRGSRQEAVEALRARADRAVAGHLLSDVPVGLFLSGGVDSTGIATVCRRLNRTVDAYTFSMEGEGEKDEILVAREAAVRCGLRHETVTIPIGQLAGDFDRFVCGLDQPTVDGFNTWLMARACREHGRKVALSGLGGDELFGGYSGMRKVPWLHRFDQCLSLLPKSIRSAFVRLGGRSLTACQREKLADLTDPGLSLNELALCRRRLFSRAALARMGFGDVDGLLNPIAMPLESDLAGGTRRGCPVSAIGVLDARFYMRNTLLRDADVCGMANGVEIRVPWLDRGIVELVFSFPGEWRQPERGINKPLLVEAAGVPDFVSRRRKTGFNLPFSRWLRTGLRERCEHAKALLVGRGELDPAGVRAAFDAFDAYPDGPEWSRVWMLMVLARWLEALDEHAAGRP